MSTTSRVYLSDITGARSLGAVVRRRWRSGNCGQTANSALTWVLAKVITPDVSESRAPPPSPARYRSPYGPAFLHPGNRDIGTSGRSAG
jgi:hypothetical protein